jgi:uncharacterized delta-60 repeat protein
MRQETHSTRLLAALCCLALGGLSSRPAAAAPGDLDATFGTGGLVIEGDASSGVLKAHAVAVQGDGAIVVAGEKDGDFLVRRYLADGTPDGTFGTGGEATADFGTSGDIASDVGFFQDGPDWKIVVAGSTGAGNMAVARFLPDGALDTGFDSDGLVTIDFGGTEGAEAMAIQPDGRVVVVGGSTGPGAAVRVARLDTDGSLDATFSGDGLVTTALPAVCGFCLSFNDRGYDVALFQEGPDLKIVVVGEEVFAGSGSSFALIRYMPDGNLDTSFGGTGIVTTFPTPTNLSRLLGVAIQADGAVVAAGMKSPLNYDSAVARYLSTGVLDTTFAGGSGIFSTDATLGAMFPAGYDQLDDLVLQADGSIVAVGYGRSGAANDTIVLRVLTGGALDPTFGSGGIVTTPVSIEDDRARSVALQADGAIVVAGFIQNTVSDADLFVARYETDAPTPACGDGTVDPGEDCDDANVLDGDCCSADCAFEMTGSPCDDEDACTVGETCDEGLCGEAEPLLCAACQVCDAIDGCVDAPASGCRLPTQARKAQLLLKAGATEAKDLVVWKWIKGAATSVAELGEPAGSDGYTLCLFDSTQTLRMKMEAPAGGTCGGNPCWKAIGGAMPKGVRYRDAEATPDGIVALDAKAGDAGAAKAVLKAKGAAVPMPALGAFALPLRAQLQSEGGTCLEAVFPVAGVIKDDERQFKARAD